MKKILLLSLAISLFSCKEGDATKQQENSQTVVATKTTEKSYASFGKKITSADALTNAEMKAKFDKMQVGDTLVVKFIAQVDKVCKKKGCWMRLKLDDSLTSFVRFKDYEFFVPLNSDNREAIVEGKAYITETSVEELQHYAKDAGKTQEEIAAITKPKREYAFMAEGVLMEE